MAMTKTLEKCQHFFQSLLIQLVTTSLTITLHTTQACEKIILCNSTGERLSLFSHLQATSKGHLKVF